MLFHSSFAHILLCLALGLIDRQPITVMYKENKVLIKLMYKPCDRITRWQKKGKELMDGLLNKFRATVHIQYKAAIKLLKKNYNFMIEIYVDI